MAPAPSPSERNSRRSPCWREDFPVERRRETLVARRELGKFLGLGALGLLFGQFLSINRRLLARSREKPPSPFPVARAGELPVKGFKTFRRPDSGEPGILIRLTETDYAAYGQKCTHLGCPLRYDPATERLVCPCHVGFFSAADGRVLLGPPRRPLPRFKVSFQDGCLWVHPLPAPELGVNRSGRLQSGEKKKGLPGELNIVIRD